MSHVKDNSLHPHFPVGQFDGHFYVHVILCTTCTPYEYITEILDK